MASDPRTAALLTEDEVLAEIAHERSMEPVIDWPEMNDDDPASPE